jgi:hypothetical protein
MKTIKVSAVIYEMLSELPRKRMVKPDFFVEIMINQKYRQIK